MERTRETGERGRHKLLGIRVKFKLFGSRVQNKLLHIPVHRNMYTHDMHLHLGRNTTGSHENIPTIRFFSIFFLNLTNFLSVYYLLVCCHLQKGKLPLEEALLCSHDKLNTALTKTKQNPLVFLFPLCR